MPVTGTGVDVGVDVGYKPLGVAWNPGGASLLEAGGGEDGSGAPGRGTPT